MKFLDYLQLDVTEESNKKFIMEYVLDYLNGLDVNEFKKNPISLKPIIKKFVSLLQYLGLNEYEEALITLSNALTNDIEYLNRFRAENATAKNIEDRLKKCNRNYKTLFNKITDAFINLSEMVPSEDAYSAFNRLYVPNYSNKKSAIELIEKAIQLINSDAFLPKRAKSQILKRLKKVLSNLKSEKADWTYYFGTIKEVTIILAAIVTIAGSEYNIDSLIGAKDKLEGATNIIEITCINQNYIEYESNTTNIFVEKDDIKKLPEKIQTESEK